MAVWTPERTVDEAEAARLIEAAFPQLAPVRAQLLGAGWDNTAFLVGGEWVFRIPRRQMAVPLLEAESAALPRLAPLLPLAIPLPIYFAPTGTVPGFPWPLAGYAHLPGATMDRAALTAAERRALAAPLGKFLKALHGVSPDGLPLTGDALGRLELTRRLPQARERLSQAADLGPVPNPKSLAALLESTPPDSRREDTVVHGDLYSRHLLLDEGRRLCGVIDWGDVHRGDPACDLTAAHLILPPEAHPLFLEAYGPVPEKTWHAAKVRAAFHSLAVLLYAAETGDKSLLTETRTALEFLTRE